MNHIKSEFLAPGSIIFRKSPSIIRTTLGSCVAVILYDEEKSFSGMCHYLNSNCENISTEQQNTYGIFAIENLIRKFKLNGSSINKLKAKIYGGAHVTSSTSSEENVCRKNIEIAHSLLNKHNISITDKNIRGRFGREIIFNSQSLEVEVITHNPSKIEGIRELFEYIIFKTGNEADTRSSVFHAEIRSHMRELEIKDYVIYKNTVLNNRKLTTELISKVTNHTTEWFRYPNQIKKIINLIEEFNKPINILSAGSSTGEEAYSLALEIQSKLPRLNFKILGIDVDTLSIEKAQNAKYSIHELSNIPENLHSKLIIKEDSFQISNLIKEKCLFEARDLRKILSLEWRFDIIICQNVLIYFSDKNKERIINNFTRFLNKNGYVFLSRKESTKNPKLKKVAPGIFNKIEN
jgi:chemotaxis protein methyltransferase CheR